MKDKEALIIRSRIRLEYALLFCLVVVAGGIFFIKTKTSHLAGWLLIVSSFLLALQFLDYKQSYLLISSEGFKIKNWFRSAILIRWCDASEFELVLCKDVYLPPQTKRVCFNLLGSYKYKRQMERLANPAAQRWDVGIVDFDKTIPFYPGVGALELADLLNKKRTEYLGIK